ncbi:MAG: tRNA 2-thiouridine(34) synthase MnmA [Chlamydiales bacterium]
MPKTVVVGMSGGVDSSVAALLLKEQGYQVIGLFMKNWEEIDERGICSAALDYEDVALVCNQLDIPYYSLNFAQEYWDTVFAPCLEQFAAGNTPNPDVLCNQQIKFSLFFRKAIEMGADFVATGHYCQKLLHQGEWLLARAKDSAKDQSYFLYTLQSSILDRVLFPLGELTKKEVRSLAKKHNLATAAKKDSTGICFIGKRPFKAFLSQHLPMQAGNLETLSGEVVGRHDGMAYYTVGQRRGLGIGGPGEPWYVVGKDPERNVVYVEQGEQHEALFQKELIASEIHWIGKEPPFPYRCQAKIRYRSPDVACKVMTPKEGRLKVEFDAPQKAITAGQSIVFYDKNLCLGGAIICICRL